MRRRIAYELKNLRESFPAELVIDEYPADLLLPLRYSIGRDESGWHALVLRRDGIDFAAFTREGAIDVVLHHLTSGVMVSTPSQAGGMRWRILYPGDAILCSQDYDQILDLLTVRYEITPPDTEWLSGVLREETPWLFAQPNPTILSDHHGG